MQRLWVCIGKVVLCLPRTVWATCVSTILSGLAAACPSMDGVIAKSFNVAIEARQGSVQDQFKQHVYLRSKTRAVIFRTVMTPDQGRARLLAHRGLGARYSSILPAHRVIKW